MLKRFSYLLISLASFFLFSLQPAFADATSSSLGSLFSKEGTEDFLPPDQAFKVNVKAISNNQLQADFTVVPGYYLYQQRIKFVLKDNTQGKILSVDLPKGEIKDDPNFGKMEVHHHDFSAKINIEATSKQLTLEATYQGCSEKGLCYAPQHKTLNVRLDNIASNAAKGTNDNSAKANTSDDQATKLLKGGNLWLILAGFFGFGLLLSLTPCVLPMVPILSGIIVGDKKVHHHATSRLHAFNLSLAYVLGMALSYTLAGIAAGLSGQLLSNALQSAPVLVAMALIFVVLSFSMFGFYELRLPTSVETRMVNTANRLKGGQFLGVFIMGALSALIVSPCVAAPLAGALLYIGQTKDVFLGGFALFALSIGMGMPLLLIGASAGHVLPKTGAWMTAVRNFFGILMLGVAIYMVSSLIPTSVEMGLWAALLIIPAIYLHALDNLPIDKISGKSHPWMRFWKGVGIILLVLGIALLIGAVSGAKSVWQPLAGLRSASASDTIKSLPFKRIKNIAELDAEINHANGKIVMLDFYADWCTSCKEMEQFTFSDPKVRNGLGNAVFLQADVTQNSPDDIALLGRFKLFGPPGIIFFSHSGQEIKGLQVIGYQDAAKFLNTVTQVNAYKSNDCNPVTVC